MVGISGLALAPLEVVKKRKGQLKQYGYTVRAAIRMRGMSKSEATGKKEQREGTGKCGNLRLISR
jgi:hypothetical protein